MHKYLHLTCGSNGTICMTAHMYQIKRKQSEIEIITPKRKFAQFNALVHTVYIYALLWKLHYKVLLCIPNMKPYNHCKKGYMKYQNSMLQENNSRWALRYRTL